MSKRCTKCGEVKPHTDFYKDCADCKVCVKTRASRYYVTHKEQVKARRIRQKEARSEGSISPNQIARFWSHVDQRGVDACWEWLLRRDGDGYGSVRLFGTTFHASRVAWMITHGDPGSLKVLHKCDNRACCNPDHLFLGTNKANSEDMVQKGRQAKGEKNGNHKLSDAEVAEIRSTYAKGGISKRALARRHGVSHRTIALIVRMDARV